MAKKSKNTKVTRSVRSVLPEVEAMLSIQTAPKAVCTLCHDEAKGQTLRLDADDQGIVRFHARASKGSKPIEVHLEWTGPGGARSRHTIEIRNDARDAASPNASTGAGMPAGVGKMHPPLQGDFLALSNQELLKAGYPPRPDPVLAPTRYARWLRIVSRPFTRVGPRTEPHPEVAFSPKRPPLQIMSPTLPLPPPIGHAMFNATSDNWSGPYYTSPAAQFFWIQSSWTVPGVYDFPPAPPYSAAAVWIGLDNGGSDLFQSGSDSECINFFFWTFTNYWMWIESLPYPPSGVPNFPISPGDEVSVDIFVADQNGMTWFQNGENGGLTPQDNSVWFMLYNYTQGASFWGTLPASPSFTGATAEFILERPAVNGGVVPLAFFGIASMHDCWYGDSEYGDRSWPLGANGSTPFVGNLTYLNMQAAATGDTLAIAFSLPDTATGGSEVLWVWTAYS